MRNFITALLLLPIMVYNRQIERINLKKLNKADAYDFLTT